MKKVWNPDYIALGKLEFGRMKRQDPGYKYSKKISLEEYKKLTGREWEEKDLINLEGVK